MQVPFSKKYKLPPLPNIGYTIPNGSYQGPRITKAPITVASHVKAYYWFCASLLALLVLGIIGAIALPIGINMKTLCPVSNDLMLWYVLFGITDLSVFGFILIIVSILIIFYT
jgi:hypothetical protein